MELSKKEQNEIINSTFEKFRPSNVITYEYIENFLTSILNGETTFDQFTIPINSLNQATNSSMEIKYIIQNNIYYKLCQLSTDDIDVLLFLVEDKSSTANLILRKLGEDISKSEGYLIEAFSNFRGDENFNSYLTRYIMSLVKKTPFSYKSEKKVPLPEEPEIKKKTKKKKKHQKQLPPIISITKEEQTSISFSNESIDTKNKETPIIEEPVVEEPVELVESVEESVELVEESVELVEEPVEVPSKEKLNITTPDSSSKEVIINPFLICQQRCNGIKGNGSKDNLVIAANKTSLVKLINCQNDSLFEMYLLLRLGYINNSYYDIKQISEILSISIAKVIIYERATWEAIKKIMEYQFNNYETFILGKLPS